MRNIRILLGVQLRALIAGVIRRKPDKKAANSPIALLLFIFLFLLLAVSFLTMATGISVALCLPLTEAGEDALYFAILALLSFAVNVFFSARLTQSALFEAKDNELLLVMPIPPRAILVSRMLFLWLTNLFATCILLVPAGIVYLFFGNPTVPGVIAFAVATFALPFLSLAVSCLFGWLLALLTARLRNKTLVPVIMTLAFLGIYFAVYTQAGAILQRIVDNAAKLAETVKRAFFPFWCYGAALTESVAWLPLFLLIALLPAALMIWVLDRSFIGIATATHTGKKASYRERTVGMRSMVTAFRHKELSRLFSSAPYLLNAALGDVFLFAGGLFVLIRQGMLRDLTGQLAENGLPAGLAPAIGLAAMLFIASMSLMCACATSMEGNTHWISRSLPTDGRAPLLGKLTAAFLVYLPATVFASLCIVIALRPGVAWSLLLIFAPFVFTVFMCYLGQLFNLLFPRLDWVDETAAVKQGMSVFFTMMSGYLLVTVMGVLAFLLSVFLPLWAPVLGITVLLAAAVAVLHRVVLSYGANRYLHLDD